jgi:hypothetical protein
MKSKLAIILILLMSMLNLIPPLFVGTDYFDNSYYITLWVLLAFLGFSVPFLVETLNKHFKRISILLGGWFFSGLVVEIFNITIPEVVINNNQDKVMYVKCLVFFMVGIVVIMSSETWSKQKR